MPPSLQATRQFPEAMFFSSPFLQPSQKQQPTTQINLQVAVQLHFPSQLLWLLALLGTRQILLCLEGLTLPIAPPGELSYQLLRSNSNIASSVKRLC